MRYISFLFGLLFFMTGTAWGQSDLNVFNATGRGGVTTTFATDYQALGINPANIGIADPNENMFSLGFLEVGGAFHSDALRKREVRQEIFSFSERKFTREEKEEAAKKFINKGFAFGFDMMPVGFGAHFEKVGGFAVSSRLRTTGSMHLNKFASNLLFLGYNYDNYFDTTQVISGDTIGIANNPKLFSEAFKGTDIDFASFAEVSVGYGRHIIKSDELAIYAGGAVKYMMGYGMLDVKFEDGDLTGFSSVTPKAPITYPDEVDQYNRDSSLSPVGEGYGFELGATVVINESIKLGASVVDIGSITWTGNVLKLKDNLVDSVDFAGADNYNLYEQLQAISGEGVFEWTGIEKRKQSLPTKLRLGGSIELIEDKLEVGADAVVPVSDVAGNMENAFLAVGGDYYLGRLFRISSGITLGGNYGFNIPLGVSLFFNDRHSYEIGLATQDVGIFLGQNNPTYSLSAGFFRFKF